MKKSKPVTKSTPVPKFGEVIRGPQTKLDQSRTDGWANLVTLVGTGADKRTHSQLTWDNRPPEFYEQLYAGGGIPARIVDVVPDHALRRWVDWINVENYDKNEIEERSLELDIRGHFMNTWKWARAYGGGCLHIVTDTQDPASPLQVGERVLALRDLSRWDLRIMTTDIEYDFGSTNFGHPRIYYLNLQMGAQYKAYPIHWTRMIRFDGQLVPRRTYIRNGYWHDSILNRIYNSIRNYETSNDAAAACLQDFNVDVYKLNNVAAMIGAGRENVIRDRIAMMAYTKSVINAMILDTKDEEYENKGRSIEGVAELLDKQADRLCADTDIPHTILFGESPDGSNATGNSTSQAWYNFLGAEQENYAKPKLNRLVDVLFPERGLMRPKFKALRVLDDVETADLRLKVAQTDDIYLNSGVLDPTEVTDSRFGGEEYSIDTKIDKEARDAGLIGPGSADDQGGDDGEEGSSNEGEKPELSGGPKGPEKIKGEGPSDDTERGNKAKPAKPKADLSGKGKEALDADPSAERGVEMGVGADHYSPRNEILSVPGGKPAIKSFISQTMSEPFRDPKTDPQIKGPGIPNKQRTILPTRGTGIMANSGFDFIKDAGKSGAPREGGPESKVDVAIEKKAPMRAATIIVRKGDQFLMGKRRDTGRWTLPGGIVEDGESHHQGGVRELKEETGLEATKLKFLGGRVVESEKDRQTHLNIYEYHHDEKRRPSNKLDPDKELSEFRWLSSTEPLPEDVAGNLQHPNNAALDHMGLLK